MPATRGDVCRHGGRHRVAGGSARRIPAGLDSRRRAEGQVAADAAARLAAAAASGARRLARASRGGGRRWWSASAASASGPVLALAALRRYPTLLLEQNALPGITNRLLARARAGRGGEFRGGVARTSRARGSWPATRCAPSSSRVADAMATSTAGTCAVLIFGGSQGAHAINVADGGGGAARWRPPGCGWRSPTRPVSAIWSLVREAYAAAGLERPRRSRSCTRWTAR